MSVWADTAEVVAPTAAQRAAAAEGALAVHGQVSGLGPYEPAGTEGMVHLLTDLMHLTAERGGNFAVLVRSAQRHFVEERLLADSRPPV